MGSLSPPDAGLSASYGRLPRGLDLARYLFAVTPAGAAALRCWLPAPDGLLHVGPERLGIEVVLPLTRPAAHDGAGDWLDVQLAALRRNGRPLPNATRAALAAWLAPGGRREDGLPAYEPAGGARALAAVASLPPGAVYLTEPVRYEQTTIALPLGPLPAPASGRPAPLSESDRRRALAAAATARGGDFDTEVILQRIQERNAQRPRARGALNPAAPLAVPEHVVTVASSTVQRHDGHDGQRLGMPLRRVMFAAAYDVLGWPTREVAERVLGHYPSVTAGAVLRRRAEGRAMLAQLGVWPWVHAPEGKLPRRWRDDPAYAEALAAWCEQFSAAGAGGG